MLEKMRNAVFLVVGGLVAVWAISGLVGVVRSGPLDPSGPPAPTGKTQILSLPYTITASGSYILNGNLTGVAGSNGITISADNVSLDLNGFALIGVPGSLNGVNVLVTRYNLSIRNGTVRNWGSSGVAAGPASNSQFEGLRVYSNGSAGLAAGLGSVVVDVTAQGNGSSGLSVGDGSVIDDVTARDNGGDGIFVGSESTLSNCTSTYNEASGIRLGYGNTMTNCTALWNTVHGIRVQFSHNYVLDNTAANNGPDAGASGAGINVDAGSQANRIDANNVTYNDWGIKVDNLGNLIIKNSARGNTTAQYQIAVGNTVGPIETSATPLTNPWANIVY